MVLFAKRKKYRRPRKLFEAARIAAENELLKKYGLKNKKELWKADAAIERIRRQAKQLITASGQEQQAFISKLAAQGFIKPNASIDDVLGLTVIAILERRLQSVLVKKGLAKTPRQARQLIVHKHVAINDKVVNVPSFIVTTDLEDKISLKEKKPKKEIEIMEKVEEATGKEAAGKKAGEEKAGKEKKEKGEIE